MVQPALPHGALGAAGHVHPVHEIRQPAAQSAVFLPAYYRGVHRGTI